MHQTASSGTLAGPSAVSTEEVGHRACDRYQRCLREGVPFWVLALDVFGLERIAQETGGTFYLADRADRLPEEIIFTDSGTTVIQRNDLWNMPILFLLMMTLVSVEWGYRRVRGLV